MSRTIAMSPTAQKYAEMMRSGEIPQHNWDRQVSAKEKRKIYDAYVEYYLELVKNNKPIPKRWPCKGLTNSQKQKIYEARGFASTDRLDGFAGAKKMIERKKMEEEDRRKEDEYWKCHGGIKTKEVMEVAASARRRRNSYREEKRHLKSCRRAVSKSLADIYERCLPGYYQMRWYYFTYCPHRRKLAESRKHPTFSEMREDIIAIAKADHELINAYNYIKRNGGWVVDEVERVGLFNAENYRILELPKIYLSRIFDNYRNLFINKDLASAVLLEYEFFKNADRRELSQSIKSGRGTPAESSRQLRALGFVA